jgi:hypothetical protein
MVDPTFRNSGAPKRTLTIGWTTARRETHRNDGSPDVDRSEVAVGDILRFLVACHEPVFRGV